MTRRAAARGLGMVLALLAAAAGHLQAAPLPELPGTDVSRLPPPPATDSATPDTTLSGAPGPVRPSTPTQAVGQWLAPSPSIQIERDETLLSLGEGAIFVPTMTEGRLEPQVVVDSARRTVAVGPAGQRIRVPPGQYVVRVGSGSEEQRLRFPVEVAEGRTTTVPAGWSGLTIRTIDPARQYVRGEYRLIRTDDFQSYGEGFGMPEERLADAPTWIIPPGVYKIVSPGSGFEELTNFVTVRLLRGEYIDYTLVLQEDENGIQRIVGGGMLSIAPERRRFRDWSFAIDAGGSLSWSQEVLPNQQDRRRSLSLSGLLQMRARREKNDWVTNLRGFYLGGASRTDSRRLSISPDELDGQLFLSRRLTPRFGPYLRMIAESHVFPTMIDLGPGPPYHRLYEYRDRDTSFTLLSADREEYELAPSLLPIELREGVGLNFDLLNALNLELSILFGGAARQTVAGNSLVEAVITDTTKLARLYAADPLAGDTNVVFAQRATSQTFTGLEGALDLRARYRSLSLSLTPEMFYSLQPRGELELRAISILSFRISRYLHADYRFTIRRNLDEDALHRYPSTHQVLLRFSFVL